MNTSDQPGFDRELSCDQCGRHGAYAFSGVTICLDCYEANGSCCPEFGCGDHAD